LNARDGRYQELTVCILLIHSPTVLCSPSYSLSERGWGRAPMTRVAMANPRILPSPRLHFQLPPPSTAKGRLHVRMQAKRCRPSRQAASSRLRQLGDAGLLSLQPASPSDRAIYSCRLPAADSCGEWELDHAMDYRLLASQ
jgi:hypothetical protein